jgi:hypothetical protein
MASPEQWKVVRVGLICGLVGALLPFVLYLLGKTPFPHVPFALFLILCPPYILTIRDWEPNGFQMFELLTVMALLNAGIYGVVGLVVSVLKMNA